MERMNCHRSTFWNKYHYEALELLTSEWQRATFFKEKLDMLGVTVLDDLVEWGKAERKDEPMTTYGIPRGSKTFYRLQQEVA